MYAPFLPWGLRPHTPNTRALRARSPSSRASWCRGGAAETTRPSLRSPRSASCGAVSLARQEPLPFCIRDIKLFRFPRCTFGASDVRSVTPFAATFLLVIWVACRHPTLGHFGHAPLCHLRSFWSCCTTCHSGTSGHFDRAAHPAQTTMHALAPRHANPRVSRQHGCTPWHPCNQCNRAVNGIVQSCNRGTVQSVASCNQWHHTFNGNQWHPFGVRLIEPR
jgi:hypothetical protein